MNSLRLATSQRGQDLIEYALTLPILLLLMAGIIDFGIIVFSYDTIANAAREGARTGIIAGATDADVTSAVRATAVGLDQNNLVVSLDRSNSSEIRVSVAYDVTLLTGYIRAAAGGSNTLSVSTVAAMRYE